MPKDSFLLWNGLDAKGNKSHLQQTITAERHFSSFGRDH